MFNFKLIDIFNTGIGAGLESMTVNSISGVSTINPKVNQTLAFKAGIADLRNDFLHLNNMLLTGRDFFASSRLSSSYGYYC